MRTIAAVLLAACWTRSALGHGVVAEGSRIAWTFDPWVVVPLLVLGLLYVFGACRLWQRAARHPVHVRQNLAFLCGWISLAGALLSPLHWLGERMFAFHMIEHEIVMAVSAPLIVMARPIGPLLWALPRRVRHVAGRTLRLAALRSSWDWLSGGRNATLLHGIAIWVWHAPPLFDAAVANIAVHRLQHLSFLATAILFWWSVLRRSDAGTAAWHVFITMLHTSVLGALMALAPRVLYQAQTATAAAWGLTPLEDQELAGLIMWVPAGTIYAGAALALLAVWIGHASQKSGAHDAVGAV
jgi:cytochrome c oxidase assembly factor CtaG